MTWKQINFVLAWGVPPGRPTGVPSPVGTYTVHLPPGTPGWAAPKAVGFLREWSARPVRVARSARWVTAGVAHRPGGRWATGGAVRGHQVNLIGRPPRRWAPAGYDLTGWRHPVRGVTLLAPPWELVLHGETQLVRPRYV